LEEESFSKVGVEELVESSAMRTGSAEDVMEGLKSEFWVWNKERQSGNQCSRSKKSCKSRRVVQRVVLKFLECRAHNLLR